MVVAGTVQLGSPKMASCGSERAALPSSEVVPSMSDARDGCCSGGGEAMSLSLLPGAD